MILEKLPAEPESWDNVLALVKKAQVPGTFLDEQERNQGIVQKDLFATMDLPPTSSDYIFRQTKR